jgi:hypothetical protein
MIVTERILVNIGLEILRTNGMIDPCDATLNQTPKSLNAVSVDIPSSVDLIVVQDSLVLVSDSSHVVIRGEFVSIEGGVPINHAVHKGDKSFALNILNDTGYNFTIPLCGPNDLTLTLSSPTALARSFTPDIGFVYLDLSGKRFAIIIKESSNLMKHAPCCLVSNACFPLYLLGGDTASGGSHAIHDLKPSLKWCRGLVEYSVGGRVDLSATIVALIARAVPNLMVLRYLLALCTMNTFRPSLVLDVFKASIIGRELLLKVFCSVFLHRLTPLHHVLYHRSVHVVKG